jgi:hypothetical protein
MRYLLIAEVILLGLLVFIEKVYTPTVILSIIALIGLIFVNQILKNSRRRFPSLLLLLNFLMVELFFLDFILRINEKDQPSKLPLPYQEIGSIAYALCYLTIIVLFLLIILNLIIYIIKPKRKITKEP